jgi:transposase
MMDAVYRCCAAGDIDSKTIAVCVRRVDDKGKLHKETRTFGTMTRDLLALSDWLAAECVTHFAMESTGVFWKPIYNILEGQFEILLVNARHVKSVPGRKTDVKDCEWLAQLLQCGLLRGSFIPPGPQRDLRDLTRLRTQLTWEAAAVSNRIYKILEDANVKLGLVATDVLGVSGRKMIGVLIEGQSDTEKMAEMARGGRKIRIGFLSPRYPRGAQENREVCVNSPLGTGKRSMRRY